MTDTPLNTEAAARVHYVDPRVRQLAEARWRLITGGSRAAWLALGKDNPEALIAEGRDWIRAAVAAGILPPPADRRAGRFSCTGPCARGVCGMAWTEDRCGQCCECRLTCDGPPPSSAPADPSPTADDELREQYAEALRDAMYLTDWGSHTPTVHDYADRLMAVRDRSMDLRTTERDVTLQAFNSIVLQVEDVRAVIARVRALRDTWRHYTMAPQTMRLVGELGAALDGPPPAATAPTEEAGR